MSLKGKRLLILSGPRLCCEIVNHARSLGVVTGVTDWYPYEKSPAKQIADEAYYVDTSNIEAIVNLIREKHFDGVFTGFTDSVLPYYGEICTTAGIPCYGTKELFQLFIDKKKYKQILKQYDIPTIPEYTIRLASFDEDVESAAYPLLVKPTDGSGARGISICSSKTELKKAILTASACSKKGEYIVERYYDDPEVTVFWLFIEGRYYLHMMGNRHVKHNQEGVIPLPVGYTYPASVLPKYTNDLAPKFIAMFKDVGIKNGMMFIQCKIHNDTCVVYDIGYRLTASFEYINCQGLNGYNPIDLMIEYALTGAYSNIENILPRIDPYLNGEYGYNVSLLCKPGRIEKITGLKEVKSIEGVLDVIVEHPEGDVITEQMKGQLAQICVRVIGKATSCTDMKRKMLAIQNTVKIISDRCENLLLPGIQETDFHGCVL